MRRMLLLCAAFMGCGHADPQDEDVRSWNGLRLTLSLQDPQPAVGQPIRVRLELTNSGDRPMYYDAQGIDYGSFELKGPGGRPAPQMAPHGQTFGWPKPISPNETVVLLKDYDLATEYLIDKAGPWRVRFRSELMLKEQQQAQTAWVPMTSEWIEFRLGEGKAAPWMEVARRLLEAKRPGWHLSVGGYGPGIYATLRSPDYVHSPPFRTVDIRIGPGSALKNEERLGATRWGDAFFSAGWPDLDGAWPDFRAVMREALSRP